MYRRLPPALSLDQAIEQAPALARLAHLVDQSSAMYRCVESLIPEGLRAQVKSGPVDGQDWCLMVSSNAAAAKLRQLLPSLGARLRQDGWDVVNVRVKILGQR